MRSAVWMVRVLLWVAVGTVGCQGSAAPPMLPKQLPPAPASSRPELGRAARDRAGVVTSQDAHGVPQFIRAVGDHPVPRGANARTGGHAPSCPLCSGSCSGAAPSDLTTASLDFARTMHGGGVVARYSQHVDGLEVYPGRVTVLMKRDLQLAVLSGNLHAVGAYHKQVFPFCTAPGQALALALSAHFQVPLAEQNIAEHPTGSGNDGRYVLQQTNAVHLSQPARVKRILYAGAPELEPAYLVEFYGSAQQSVDAEAFRYILSAVDGRVLAHNDLTANDAFSYRTWADASTAEPMDGPIVDYTPHPTGLPDGTRPLFMPLPNLVTVEATQGSTDPWLPANAAETLGNNVDAYADSGVPDGFSNGDLRATLTGPSTFDRIYDLNSPPNANADQTMASVTDLFVVTNWLHDFWYAAGFNEAAGNAQANNHDRGGAGGDPLHAEAQDSYAGGARNNASMSVPADGLSPRLQLYGWTGKVTALAMVTSGPDPLEVGVAAFGPQNFAITASVVLADDGVGVTTDGCEPIVNNVVGQIALVDRGACSFPLKVANAQAAGAVGVLVANNRAGPAPALGGTELVPTNVGVLSISQADGDGIKAAFMSGPVVAALSRTTEVDLDGALDHQMVAHEYAHLVYKRLSVCAAPQCAALGEGWGDFFALLVTAKDGDTLTGAYAVGAFSGRAQADSAYFGILRVPYSVDPARNALSFRHIADGEPLPTHPVATSISPNSEGHNAGEVWASMLWEVYVALKAQAAGVGQPFAAVQRRMAEYVVAGMQLAPRDATYTEARDALLAAASVVSLSDATVMAEAFARRGAGTGAVAPDRYSLDNVGVVEASAVSASAELGPLRVLANLKTCDADSVLDAEERGEVVVDVMNPGPLTLQGASLQISTPAAGVGFPAGATVALDPLGPYELRTVRVEILLDPTLVGVTQVDLNAQLDAPGACVTSLTSTLTTFVNMDEAVVAMVDDVEPYATAWTVTVATPGVQPQEAWERQETSPTEHVWAGLALGRLSDTALESPVLNVSAAEPLVIAFEHSHDFEESGGLNWDGAVLEVSGDTGIWSDVSGYVVDPGYNGTITEASGNPLALRSGLVGRNLSYPAMDRVTLDFGAALAGQGVRFRFRSGTDLAAANGPWLLDNISVAGITNTPFFARVDDAATCPVPLIANAGPDQTVGLLLLTLPLCGLLRRRRAA